MRRVTLPMMVVVLLHAPVEGRPVKESAPPPTGGDGSAAAFLASVASECGGQPVAADALDGELPLGLVVLLRDCAKKPAELEPLLKDAKGFTAAWADYAARKKQVDDALEKAAAAEKAHKLDDAQKLIEAVISAATRDAKGKLGARNAPLLTADAEFAALEALARVGAQRQDFASAMDACSLMSIRVRAGSEADERVVWLAAHRGPNWLGVVEGNAKLEEAIQSLARPGLSRQRRGPSDVARSHYQSLMEIGLAPIDLMKTRTAKKGQWVQFRLKYSALKMTGKTGAFHHHYVGEVPYDCRLTDRLVGYDRASGRFSYERACKMKKVTEDIDLQVDFAEERPAWATHGIVAGKVDSVAPRWHITDAFAVDGTFLDAVPETQL